MPSVFLLRLSEILSTAIVLSFLQFLFWYLTYVLNNYEELLFSFFFLLHSSALFAVFFFSFFFSRTRDFKLQCCYCWIMIGIYICPLVCFHLMDCISKSSCNLFGSWFYLKDSYYYTSCSWPPDSPRPSMSSIILFIFSSTSVAWKRSSTPC